MTTRMNRRTVALTLAAAIGLPAAFVACADQTVRDDGRKTPIGATDREELSYGVGFYLGEEIREGLRMDEVNADLDLVARGFADALHELDPAIPRATLDEVLYAVHEEMQRRMVARLLREDTDFQRLHDQNLERSRAFHAQFEQEPDVVTTSSGAQYRVLRTGSGPKPGLGDTVVANYRVTVLDGTVVNAGVEDEVPLTSVRAGARELLQMMPVGSKWEVAVPPELAYGGGGDPPRIGPNETLRAEIELVAIK